jgi:hypothetical protein
MSVMKPGRVVGGLPLPPVPEHTTYVDAGRLRIGVEYRVLTDAIIEETVRNTEGLILVDDRPVGLHAEGTSLHICDRADGSEILRFDVFPDEPHYHYLSDGENRIVVFDDASCGDMWPWTLECLRSRLPEMLCRAGAEGLAEEIDVADMVAAIPQIEAIATKGRIADAGAMRQNLVGA